MQTEIQKSIINRICNLQLEIEKNLKLSLDNAIEIGSLLAEQKGNLPHGEFGNWIELNMPFGDRTARNYMKLYENRDRLKTETVSDLAGAYKLLTHQKEKRMKEKHRLNIFPEMQKDEYARLLEDLKINGFDSKQPIYLYQDAVLDGWQREKACNELNITPIYKEFIGFDIEAFNYVMRTNTRGNLNSGQWACIAVEAEDTVANIIDDLSKNGESAENKHPHEYDSKD